MVLQALEFTDCLLDSPHFREKLNAHEKELDSTNTVIKKLIHQGKELINSAKRYASAQRTFAQTLRDFKFETIGSQQTDDEIVISKSLKNFGELIDQIEDARDIMLEKTNDTFVNRLETFRKEHIVSAKDERKRFEKTTKQYYATQEKYLNMKLTKTADGQFQDADAQLDIEKQSFHKESMTYVNKLQEVQERKKFEFVETLLAFMKGWLTFYHQGYECGLDMQPYMDELSGKVQKTRDNFESTRDAASLFMARMLEKPIQESPATSNKMFTRQGYLFVLEKKALGTMAWTKYFCSYQKDTKIFSMILYNQQTNNAGKLNLTPDTLVLESCTRRATDSIDRRFCMDVIVKDRPNPLTLQALSDQDRADWMQAMDGKDPIYAIPPVPNKDTQELVLNESGTLFVTKCIEAVESRGLTDQGLYRVVGVTSKVQKLMQIAVDPKRVDKLNLMEQGCEFEVKTITSALKSYFRKLSEPLMTFRMHQKLITAAKLENKMARISDISILTHKLPPENYKMLKILTKHLQNVSLKHEENLMNVSNLSVCFGPTLLWPEEESVAAIMDIKFCNVVVEILIENYDSIFENTQPSPASENGSTANPMRPPVPVKSPTSPYSEESTYGKHRPNYRPNSVYTNNVLTQPKEGLYGRDPGFSPPPALAKFDSSSPSSNSGGSSSSADSVPPTARADLYASRSAQQPQRPKHTSFPAGAPRKDTKPLYANSPFITADVKNSPMSHSYAGTPSSGALNTPQTSSPPPPGAPLITRRVRTIYACDAENDSELSFEPNQIIYNVKESREPGWLEGTLNGKTGLIPANYIEYLPS